MEKKVKTEREDFTTLFERCRKPFTQFAYSYMRDWEVAEDIFSEAMVQYWMKRDELDVDTNPRAYILTLVKHLSLNYLRHQQVRITVEEELFQSAERELAFRIRTLHDCDPRVEKLLCEGLENPMGMATVEPRFSWQMRSDMQADRQTAYQILVASTEQDLKEGEADLWDSGKIDLV